METLVERILGTLMMDGDNGGSAGGSTGEGAEGTDTKTGSDSSEGKKEDTKKEGKDTTKKEKSFTQADVDKLVKERLAREKKKYEKEIETFRKNISGEKDSSEGEGEGKKVVNEETLKAQKLLEASQRTMIESKAIVEAVTLGVDPQYTKDVVRLADLADITVDENGVVDTSAISSKISEVVGRIPMFKASNKESEDGSGFKVGGTGNKGEGGNKSTGWKNADDKVAPKPWNKFNRK
jgi:hypothetical protein